MCSVGVQPERQPHGILGGLSSDIRVNKSLKKAPIRIHFTGSGTSLPSNEFDMKRSPGTTHLYLRHQCLDVFFSWDSGSRSWNCVTEITLSLWIVSYTQALIKLVPLFFFPLFRSFSFVLEGGC